MVAHESIPTPDALFALVEQYEAFGHHQTGSAGDRATAAWFVTALAAAGVDAAIDALPFEVSRRVSNLTVAGREIDHLVVPYEWEGTLELAPEANATDIHVTGFDPKSGGFADILAAPIAEARARGASVAVLATEHPDGSLVAVNRPLVPQPSGMPTVLIAGRDLHEVRDGAARGAFRLQLSQHNDADALRNVVGVNLAAHELKGPHLILTTPLTGWFGCAGERGTGIAVLLGLLPAIRHIPLLIIGASGHELGFAGGHGWVERELADPRHDIVGIAHIGASVAVLDAGSPTASRELASTRFAMTSEPEAEVPGVGEALAGAALSLRFDVTSWVGEGEAFSRLGHPVLSCTGAGRAFHTPEDTAAGSTSPEALHQVTVAMADAIDTYHRHISGGSPR